VKTSVSEFSLGAWSEVLLFSKPVLSLGTINLGAGLDGDVSSIRVQADRKTGESIEGFADAKSLLGVASLRTSASIEIPTEFAGFIVGVTLQIPVIQVFRSFSATVASDPLPSGKGLGLDLKEALDHRKNPVALEVAMGINILF